MGLLDELATKINKEITASFEELKKEKEQLSLEINKFNKEVTANTTLLKDFNPAVKHVYEVADKELIREVEVALKDFKNEINIKVENINRFQIKDLTKKFLVWWWIFSFSIVCGAVYYGWTGVTFTTNHQESYDEGLRDAQAEFQEYQKYMKKHAPNTNKRYQDQN
jgi:uncharacterized membrane-anchored protein YhcB (DUF1043 family)